MAHLRVHLSTEAFDQLREIAGRNRRGVAVEGSLILEAALSGVDTHPTIRLTSVGIRREAALAVSGEPLAYTQRQFDDHMAGMRRTYERKLQHLEDRIAELGGTP